MRGTFGTFTVQSAIQVGEIVETKVRGISSRTVSMSGGNLSIEGVGLEAVQQISMNGQLLELVSKTETKVIFKVPASTVASVNSIMVKGSFAPLIIRNAVTYTK